MGDNRQRAEHAIRADVTALKWSADELHALLILRSELEPLGVVYIATLAGTRVFPPDPLMPHVRGRIAKFLARPDDELPGGAAAQAAPSTRRTARRAGAKRESTPSAKIKTVVTMLHDGRGSIEQRSRASGLSSKAVRRVIQLYEKDVFKIGPRGGLLVATRTGEFRHARKFEMLRDLEKALEREI